MRKMRLHTDSQTLAGKRGNKIEFLGWVDRENDGTIRIIDRSGQALKVVANA
jgi:hypothetical protein